MQADDNNIAEIMANMAEIDIEQQSKINLPHLSQINPGIHWQQMGQNMCYVFNPLFPIAYYPSPFFFRPEFILNQEDKAISATESDLFKEKEWIFVNDSFIK